MGSKLGEEDVEVIKVELPKWLAEKFRRYVAEKYGFRRGALSKALADIIERELGTGWSSGSGNVDAIVGLGLLSDYEWWGEDLVEALRRKYSLPDRR
ncbi:MAG: hypothetical protein QXW39_06290 [Candidatus Bathyarchaeia archaeon]